LISGSKNKGYLSKSFGVFITFLITFAFLYFAFKGIDFFGALSIIAHSSLYYIFLYVIIFLISHYLRSLRWRIMLKSVKKDLSEVNLFGSVIIGYGVSCVIPRLGELYRGLFLGKWEGISRSTILGSIIVERFIDVISFAFAAVLSIIIFPGNLLTEINWLRISLLIGFIFIVVFTLFLIIIIKYEEHLIHAFIKISKKYNEKFASKLEKLLTTLIDGLACVKGVKNLSLIILISSLILFAYALNSYVGFYIIDMGDYGKINFGLAWVVMTISAFGSLIPTPGGVGTYHAISIYLLVQIYNFDSQISAAYALITNFITYSGFVIATVLMIFIINRIRAKKKLPRETFITVLKS
jgi:uncharacterized protein (TIRG00374 family)